MPDTWPSDAPVYACCCITEAHDVDTVRQLSWEFHKHHNDDPDFSHTVDQMIRIALSPTGQSPATHFVCSRGATRPELDRIEAWRQECAAQGLERTSHVYHVAAEPFRPDVKTHSRLESVEGRIVCFGDVLAGWEAFTLARLGLRRIP